MFSVGQLGPPGLGTSPIPAWFATALVAYPNAANFASQPVPQTQEFVKWLLGTVDAAAYGPQANETAPITFGTILSLQPALGLKNAAWVTDFQKRVDALYMTCAANNAIAQCRGGNDTLAKLFAADFLKLATNPDLVNKVKPTAEHNTTPEGFVAALKVQHLTPNELFTATQARPDAIAMWMNYFRPGAYDLDSFPLVSGQQSFKPDLTHFNPSSANKPDVTHQTNKPDLSHFNPAIANTPDVIKQARPSGVQNASSGFFTNFLRLGLLTSPLWGVILYRKYHR